MSAFLALLFGLLLIVSEFFVPGGVLGVSGVVLVLSSIALFVSEFNNPLLILAFIVLVGVSTFFVCHYTLKFIQKRGGAIYHNEDQSGYVASKVDQNLIGKEAVTSSRLAPSGYIQIEGKRHQAVSNSGFIDKGVKVLVVGGEGAHLSVRELN